ncbi:MAG TPA: amidase [Novosphingobium sp.]
MSEFEKPVSPTFTRQGVMAASRAADEPDLTWLPAWQLRELVIAKRVSALEVTDHFLERVARLDPLLHMFRQIDPDAARASARAADRRMAKGEAPGPLHGIPIALKENVAMADMPLSNPLDPDPAAAVSRISTRDSVVADRLRRAGAIIVGVSIMPGMGVGPGMTDLVDHPRNPWDPSRVPGSSSAGSAAAVASAALPVAIGSDGGGSTRLPAAMTGIIGLHTTIGRVPHIDPQRPRVNLTSSLGPMTRDVRDAAMIMNVIAGPDGRDMLSSMHGPAPDYTAGLGRGVTGLRLAWTDDFGFGSRYAVAQTPQVVAAVRSAALRVGELGARVECTGEVWESFHPHVFVTELAYGIGRPGVTACTDAIEEAFGVRQRNLARFQALFADHDLLMSPTIQFTAPTVDAWDASWKDPNFVPVYTSATYMFNWLGFPAISVPCGLLDGMPVGLQMLGPPNSEPLLLRVADAFLRQFPRNERAPVS